MSPPFDPPVTFMGVPHRSEPGDAKAVVLGLPFDCGTHPHRIGSRQGPSAIRKMSLLIRRYDAETGIDPLAALNVVDLGDAQVMPGEIEPSYRGIEAALDAALANGAIPVTMGGDGAISLPEMRALNRRYPNLAFVHLDAHTDAYTLTVICQHELWLPLRLDQSAADTPNVRFGMITGINFQTSAGPRMGWTGRAPAPNDFAGGTEARGAHRHVPEDGNWIGLHDRHRYRQEHTAFGWPRCQGSSRLTREARAQPDCSTACECAALPNRHRGWHGDALCGPGAACARA
jgi:hypothetical protein